MNLSFNDGRFMSAEKSPQPFPVFQEDEYLSTIKKKLLHNVNTFRSRCSLPELSEDHSISKLLEATPDLHLKVIKPEDIISQTHHKLLPSDIRVLTSKRQVSTFCLNQDNPMASIESCYLDILNQMMQITYKEYFSDKKVSNIAFDLRYDHSEVFMTVVFSQTILSVESIYIEGDQYSVTGRINTSIYSLFILLIKFKDYNVVISPNKMSYDHLNHTYKIKIDKKHLSLNINYNPTLQFYVKAGKGSVKYNLGSDLNYQDIIRMSSILTLAYSMPLAFVESPYIQPTHFLSRSLFNQSTTVSNSSSKTLPSLLL